MPDGAMVVYSNHFFKKDEKFWTLEVRKEATEEDLKEHSYHEGIGETIWETAIEILICTYCAEKFLNG